MRCLDEGGHHLRVTLSTIRVIWAGSAEIYTPPASARSVTSISWSRGNGRVEYVTVQLVAAKGRDRREKADGTPLEPDLMGDERHSDAKVQSVRLRWGRRDDERRASRDSGGRFDGRQPSRRHCPQVEQWAGRAYSTQLVDSDSLRLVRCLGDGAAAAATRSPT